MKTRRFAALSLGIFLLLMQMVAVQAAMVDEGPTPVEKFPELAEETVSDTAPALTPKDGTSIQIDKFTGEELGTENAEVGGNRVVINDTVVYDREMRAFVYQSGRDEIISNVASGMITTEPVWLYVPEGVLFHLYRDGKLLEDVNYSNISEPGAYTFCGDRVDDVTEIMHFTVVSPVTGQLSRFQVPEGFVISSALLGGIKIPSERTYVDVIREGEYDISYRCPVTEAVYMFRATVDHTPPTLALAAVREDNTAKGPVDISDLEEGAEIGVWLNNKKISYEEILTRSGRYRIVLTDEAGNMSTYHFTIRAYFTTNSILFFLALLAIAVGVGIYALYSRRHLRIR